LLELGDGVFDPDPSIATSAHSILTKLLLRRTNR
jgi:hypothetical protein